MTDILHGTAPRPFLALVTPRIVRRFRQHVDRSGGPDACWPWRRQLNQPNGYGRFFVGRDERGQRVYVYAHRFAYVVHRRREVPEVGHSCHSRPCCNPRHLLAVTHQQNMVMMIEAGRYLPRRDARGRFNGWQNVPF